MTRVDVQDRVRCTHGNAAVIGLFLAVRAVGVSPGQSLEPVTPEEFEQYARIVDPTESLNQLLLSVYSDYNAIFNEEYMPLLREWYSNWSVAEHASTPNPALYQAAYAAVPGMVERLNALDERLFQDMATVVGNASEKSMSRLRRARLRVIFRNDRDGPYELRTDLIAIARPFAARLETADRTEFEEWVDQFEIRFIESLQEMWRSRREWRVVWTESASYETRIRAERDAAKRESRPLRDDLISQWEAEQARINDRAGRMAIGPYEQLRALLREGRLAMIDLLPVSMHGEFDALFRAAAFPMLHPDPGSAESLYDAALALQTLDERQRAAILDVRDRFRAEHQRLTDRMQESETDRAMASIRNDPDASKRNGEFWEELFALGCAREKLNSDQLILLRGILAPEQQSLLPEWDFAAIPRPRPWDPRDVRLREMDERRKQREEDRDR